jgi:hypothetical protein
MELLLIGLVSAFNMLIIKFKLEKKRFADAVLDLFLMAVLGWLFKGTYAGMVVAMVASMSISLFLLVSPPKFTGTIYKKVKDEFEEAKRLNSLD